jgi:tetratricopeptide (TPR) repeat protein
MIIIIPIKDSFLFFPNSEGNIEKLKKEVKAYYEKGNINPDIEIHDDFIKITIASEKIEFERKRFGKLISLCENGHLLEAEKLVKELVTEFPAVSEYHRIGGQIKSELDKPKEAVDYLIDALRWDPKNVHALLMMGNLFAQKKDIETALKYYYQVLEIKPDDNLTLNNIGAQLMQVGKKDDAIFYFQKALEADPEYPNTYLALGLVSEKEGHYNEAFEFATLGMAGIDPKKKNYSVPSIKESSFSGYKTLAYYYVSWALASPELVESLQMPFDKEFDLATKFLEN